jgi:hypothetical protein
MKGHRTTVSTLGALSLLVGLSALAPAGALAGGPLLSGYGGPGAGAQSIIGATLLNGPGRGSGTGGSGGGSSPSSGGGAAFSGAPASSSAGGAASRGGSGSTGAGGGQAAGAHGATRAHGGSVPGPGAPSTSSSSVQGEASAATLASADTPWFSGADVLALVTVAGALALMAVATMRLAGTRND